MYHSGRNFGGGGGTCPRIPITILSISIIAIAMIGTFVLFDGDDFVEVSGQTSGTCGKLNWTLDDDGILTITGIGTMSTKGNWDTTAVKTVVIDNGITSICNSAFKGCTKLISVTIPDSVTSIGSSAFYNCEKLTSVIIPNSVTKIGKSAFEKCTGLTSVIIPNSVTSIGDSAFCNCEKLTSVIISDSVTSIGSMEFYNCAELTSVTIPNSVTSIGDSAFYNCEKLTSVIIPNSVTKIGKSAYGCTGLTSVTIPNSVTSIEQGAFGECYSLKEINVDDSNTKYSSDDGILFDKYKTKLIRFPIDNIITAYSIPNTVTCIEQAAFKDCTKLTSVVIPDSVTKIENYAFSQCTGLTKIDVSKNLTSIGGAAFVSCSNLTSFEFPEQLKSIGNSAFSGCTSLTSVVIPDSVTKIEDYAFRNCSGLTSVKLSERLTEIGYMTFGNTGLTSITIPDSVTKIGDTAFFGCTELASITIPDSVTSVGSQSFSKCSNLLRIVFGKNLAIMGNQYGVPFPDHTFYGEDGSILDQTKVENFAGFIFKGDSIDKMVWTLAIKHHVTYEQNCGSGDAPKQEDVLEDDEFEVKGYTGIRAGYTFIGWTYNGIQYKEGNKIKMGTNDITLTATWTPLKITFDHSNLTNATGKQDSDLKLPEDMDIGDNIKYIQLPDTAGYRHTGWIIDEQVVKPTADFVKNTTHTAVSVWSKIPTFIPIPDGGDNEPAIPVFPDQMSQDERSYSTSATIVAIGCVVVLLAILALIGSFRTKK